MKEDLVQQTNRNNLRLVSSIVSVLVIFFLANLHFAFLPALLAFSASFVLVYKVLIIATVVIAFIVAALLRFATDVYSKFTIETIKRTEGIESVKQTISNLSGTKIKYGEMPWRAWNWFVAIVVMSLAATLGMWTLFVFELLSELFGFWLVMESERSALLLSIKVSEVERA